MSDEAQICVGCHGEEQFSKELGNGRQMSLYVNPLQFMESVHAILECTNCHTAYGTDEHPTLTFRDTNPPAQRTGWNIHRSSDPAPMPAAWPLIASNTQDGDPGTPDLQWTDTTGDPSPSGLWYYQLAAVHSGCGEGPF